MIVYLGITNGIHKHILLFIMITEAVLSIQSKSERGPPVPPACQSAHRIFSPYVLTSTANFVLNPFAYKVSVESISVSLNCFANKLVCHFIYTAENIDLINLEFY